MTSTPITTPAGTTVDDDGIHLPAGLDQDIVIDVRFAGHRVWSVTLADAGRPHESGTLVRWPRALKERLDGTTAVTIAPHDGGEAWFEADVTFGGGAGTLELVDDVGNPLALDKGNRLQRNFEDMAEEARRELVDAARRVLDDLVERCGLDAYLAYGCLLGAVRDGHMIGHDSDADLAWLSVHQHPFDVIRESRAAEQTMRDAGWHVVRMSAANFKVWSPMPNGKRAGIDVFGSFHVGNRLHITGSLVGELPRSAMVPFTTVELEGVGFPAPHDLEAFLAFTYGPRWRVPDPAFHFHHPQANVRLMSQWLRGTRTRLYHWQDFYSSRAARQLTTEHSPFAAWVAERVEPGARIVEVGAGTGRDAFWLADQGFTLTAGDYCGQAHKLMLDTNGRRVDIEGLPYVACRPLNLEADFSWLSRAAMIAHEPGVKHVYGRFLVESLAPEAWPNLWRFCRMVCRTGGHTFLEFRTGAEHFDKQTAGDPNAVHRTRVDPDLVVASLEHSGGRVVERVEGRGLAQLASADSWDDPVVCRLDLTWTPDRPDHKES